MANSKNVKRQTRYPTGLIAFGAIGFAISAGLLLWQPWRGADSLVHRDGQLVFEGNSAEDILSAGKELLIIEYAHVIDNGEGQWPPHGPYGSIHVIAYRPEQRLEPPWDSELKLYETMLYGPHRTVGDLYEWLDNEELAFANYALYDWSRHGLDQVVLRFYESDPGIGREHDALLAVLVSREETEERAITASGDKMEVRLRTRTLTVTASSTLTPLAAPAITTAPTSTPQPTVTDTPTLTPAPTSTKTATPTLTPSPSSTPTFTPQQKCEQPFVEANRIYEKKPSSMDREELADKVIEEVVRAVEEYLDHCTDPDQPLADQPEPLNELIRAAHPGTSPSRLSRARLYVGRWTL